MNRLNQTSQPLAETLERFSAGEPAYFCIPGHRFERGVSEELKRRFGDGVFRYDLTEANGLDDLHRSTGAIRTAQELAADLYGADTTRFLVNGTTCGLESLMLALAGPGDEVIVPRNAHQCVASGLVLSGAKPVWVLPHYERDWGFYAELTPACVEEAIRQHPRAKAVFLVSPTYYGVCSNTEKIAEICHAADLPLVTDEAHGAHLYFSESLPKGALACGADAAVVSTHKTVGSMTQTSLLHLKGSRVCTEKVDGALRMLMSSSPSYVLMTSLDAARFQLAKDGKRMAEAALALAVRLRTKLEEIPGIAVFGGSDPERLLRQRTDGTRVVFSALSLGISGFALSDRLYAEAGIALEMADAQNAVAVVTWANTQEETDRLAAAVRRIAASGTAGNAGKSGNTGNTGNIVNIGKTGNTGESLPLTHLPEAVLTPREAYFKETETAALSACRGRICAESIAPYPPGIPVIQPGERLDGEIVAFLLECQKRKIPVHTTGGADLARIRVIRRESEC